MIKNKSTFFKLAMIILALSLIVTGCSSANFDKAPGENTNEGEGYFDDSDQSEDFLNLTSLDRKFIFTSNLKIETTEYEKSINALEELVVNFNGFIQESTVERQSSVSQSNKLRIAQYALRIPSEKRAEFITKSGDVGVILVNETKGEDVTEKFLDSAARKNSLEVQETRLLALLEEAESLSEILDIEDRLSTVRFEIETLTGTLNQLSSLIDLSTVYVEIREVKTLTEPTPETFWAQVSDTFNASLDALVKTLKFTALAIVAVFPFIVVITLFVLILIFIIKVATRRKKAKKNIN